MTCAGVLTGVGGREPSQGECIVDRSQATGARANGAGAGREGRPSNERISEVVAGRHPEFDYAPVPIDIHLCWGGIEQIGVATPGDASPSLPVDAIAVGHSLGETHLRGAEMALDIAVSRALGG